MPPLINTKRLGELHVAAALREDFEHLLSSFCAGGDLSFGQFKVHWKAGNLNNIHHGKSEKVGYKAFLQLVYEAVLLLLRNDLTDELDVTSSTHPLLLITDSVTRKCVWNIGVVYCLYTIYNTQLRSQQEPSFVPVHVGPETAVSLSTAVQQLSTLAEFGRTAVSIYQTMLKADAFRCCAYTGPTSLHYCQKAAKKATAQVADTIHTLVESVSNLTTTSESSSSSANARQSRVVAVTDAAAVHLIRQVYSMRASGHPLSVPVAASGTAVEAEIADVNTVAVVASEADKESRVAELAAAMNGEEPAATEPPPPPPPPPVLDVTEYLTQSIAERRQMRADKAKQRQLHQKELEAARVERLRASMLKRLEKHDAANQAPPAPTPAVETGKTTNRRGPRRTHAMRLQEEAAQQDAILAETSGGPSRNTRRGSAPPRTPQLLETPPGTQPSRRTRASSKELPDNASAPRLVSTGRRVAETHASRDAYLQENNELMEDFEEFVGLRPKATRPTASSTTSGGNSKSVVMRGVRSTRSTQVEEEPEVHLDAATGDIMEILRQLEQDSQRVLDRGGSGRALRSNTTTAAAPPAPAARTARASSAVTVAAPKAALAPRQARAPPAQQSPPSSTAGFGGLELREVGKKRKAAAVAPAKKARITARRAALEEEEPVADDDIMGMLRRLERESDRILGGGAGRADESEESDTGRNSPAGAPPVARRKNNRAERKESGTVQQAVPKSRAASKRRVASSGTSSSTARAQPSAPPAKRARIQRGTAPRTVDVEPAEESLSAESGDIMALLRRLEQESDQILVGGAELADEMNEDDGSEESEESGAERDSPAKSASIARRKTDRAERKTVQQAVPKTRAAPTRRTTSSGTPSSARAQPSAPPAKRAGVQRVIAPRVAGAESVDEALSAGSGDIMTLLQRLEQESDQILSGEAPTATARACTETSAVTASEPAIMSEVETRKRARAPPPASNPPGQPSRASRRGDQIPPVSEKSSLPPAAKAPRKAAAKAKAPAKTSTAKQKARATPPVPQDDSPTVTPREKVPVAAESSAVRTEAVAGGGGVDIMDMLKQLEDEANGILSARK